MVSGAPVRLVWMLLALMCVPSTVEAQGRGAGKGPLGITVFVNSDTEEALPLFRTLETVVGLFPKQLTLTMGLLSEAYGEEPEAVLAARKRGDTLLICALDKMKSPALFLRFVNCLSSETTSFDVGLAICYEAVAPGKGVVDAVEKCRSGEEGNKLHEQAVKLADEAGFSAVPAVIIGEEPVRLPARSVKVARQICAKMAKPAPVCARIPKPKTIKVVLLSDKRCTSPELNCNPEFVDEVLTILESQIFTDGMELQRLDYSDPEGRSTYQKEKIEKLPAFLVEKAVEDETEVMAKISRFLKATASGAWFYLNAGQTYDPTKELCDNELDDNGDGLIDCADPTCTKSLECREESRGLVELFIMSYCPYGALAVNEVKRLKEAFGDDIKIRVRYVMQREGDALRSLHGDEETFENARQMCIAKDYPAALYNYLWCLYGENEDGGGEACAKRNAIDYEAVSKCAQSDETKQALFAEAEACDALDISASPTWIVHGKVKFNSVDAAEVAQYLCTRSFDVPGCKKELPKKDGQPEGSCN